MKIKDLTPVYIKWEDAFHQGECHWTGNEDFKDFLKDSDYVCESIGWLVEDTKRMVTICLNKTGEESAILHMQRIPKGCVLKMKKIKI